eukprot:4197689-Prymnesium_polylepis.1
MKPTTPRRCSAASRLARLSAASHARTWEATSATWSCSHAPMLTAMRLKMVRAFGAPPCTRWMW